MLYFVKIFREDKKTERKVSPILAVCICGILLLLLCTGCVREEQPSEVFIEIVLPDGPLDQPSVLPDWKDGDYHDYYETTDMLFDFNVK